MDFLKVKNSIFKAFIEVFIPHKKLVQESKLGG